MKKIKNTMPALQLQKMKQYFLSGATQSFAFRKAQLKKLKSAILAHEQDIYNALAEDLRKSREETWVTETGIVISELNVLLKELKNWMQPETVPTNLLNLPSKSYIMREPLGVVLIIAPWNYPFQLMINPLLGAIAAGNCAVLKPSEFAPATSAVMKKIIEEIFPPEYILYTAGDGANLIPQMMNNFRFDHVFYTGSTAVGKIIYKMAAEKLIPVTLELGGKSPCIIESDANLKVAARRIAVAKFSNCGQMCVAPDYILVHESVKNEFTRELKLTILKFFSEDPSGSYNYGKMINEKQFDRVVSYLQDGEVIHGGRHNRDQLYIEPTILDKISVDSSVMKEEIFGPLLPIFTFSNKEEAMKIIANHPNPLAFYIFSSSNRKANEWTAAVPAGGGCINNCSWHLTNHHLPFGGRGFSGTGSYHGKQSFETFSHKKSIMKTPAWFDPDIKYPPFRGKLKLFKWVIR
ncbi:MAG TPA: aldehyde dehydrogenase [Chitinophagaceae bacterium]|nr:aldehyde dehydrogenase [Chitinophagaceae bacterium]